MALQLFLAALAPIFHLRAQHKGKQKGAGMFLLDTKLIATVNYTHAFL